MACRNLQCILPAALFIASGCMGTQAGDLARGDVVEVEPERIALRAGASVGSDEIDGFCENGAGVYLTAKDGAAQLTLYVVTPAETVTFESVLHLTSQQGERQVTETRELESVTLGAGESWLLSEHVEGTLMEAVAEIAAR